MDPIILLALFIAAGAFTLSAAAGMGGSLVLAPAFVMIFGAKEGIALAALFLAANNVAKLVVYRKTIPLKSALGLVGLTVAGAFLGARLLVAVPAEIIFVGVIVSVFGAYFIERRKMKKAISRPVAFGSAFFAGATSGFSGTSGPLKGIALRSLKLDHLHLVGAASVVSFAGDFTKVLVFTEASIFEASNGLFLLIAIPLMPVCSLLGRKINRQLGERYFGVLFWGVMLGYSIRLVVFFLG